MSLIEIPIGLYEYVFPGNINLVVLELYNLKSYKFLVCMLSLIIIFERIYRVVSLTFLSSIRNIVKFFEIIESSSYIMIIENRACNLNINFAIYLSQAFSTNKSGQYYSVIFC